MTKSAKEILLLNLQTLIPEVKNAVEIVLKELDVAEEKISEFEKEKNLLSIEDLPGENWKNIEGFSGFYQVSNYGRIKSFKKNKIIIRKLQQTKQGYLKINLCENGKAKIFLIHVLVARAFISNPENKPEVNHKDGVKNNNCVENLEWVTRAENQKHAYRIGLNRGRRGVESPRAKLTEEQVKFIRENYKAHDKEFGMLALARKFNVSPVTIKRAFCNSTLSQS